MCESKQNRYILLQYRFLKIHFVKSTEAWITDWDFMKYIIIELFVRILFRSNKILHHNGIVTYETITWMFTTHTCS